MAEVGAEAGRGAQEGLQRGQEEQLPDQELELSTGLREILLSILQAPSRVLLLIDSLLYK